MRKIFSSALIVLFSIAPAFSQKDVSKADRVNQKEKMEALKNDFFIENLEMTEEESKAFFSRKDVHDESLLVLNKKMRQLRQTMKDTTSVSAEEYAKREIEMADFQKEKIDVNHSFILDCFDILDAERAITLTELDKEFRKEVSATRKNNAKKKETP